ncbi:unnamed protein product [Orchesella dallaii]|uniref:Uncharacterized protein n=1 Tax=Orchesella dallaii TaxID=48710 RepID=A0ABP1R6J8_9HEXA
MSTEEKRVKMRAKWRYYYNQRKANGKLDQRKRVESEAQNERRRMRWKINKIQRKSKRQGQVLSEEETEKEPARCKIKEEETNVRQILEEQEPMKRGRGRPRSKR